MSGSAPGGREVAHRLFAAEFDDADFSYSESDEERAPNYVVTPTGARVNRLFFVGVLTETEQVNEEMLRARIVDPTGAFVTYAGQYQPDALAFLERAEPPAFLSVTGKARTFQPEDSDRVFTSVRPESISEVDAETRDRWVVQAARRTIERVETMAAAIDSGLSGDALREALEAEGVEPSLAAGIPLALDHYGTTPDYLEALRTIAEEALEMVAGETDADDVSTLNLNPDEGAGDARKLAATELSAPAEAETAAADSESDATVSEDEVAAQPDSATASDPEVAAAESDSDDAAPDEAEAAPSDTDLSDEVEPEPDSGPDSEPEPTDPDVTPTPDQEEEQATADEPVPSSEAAAENVSADRSEADEGGAEEASDESEADEADVDDELGDFEPDDVEFDPDEDEALTEEEREEVEAEFGTDFSTGNEVEEAGAADIDAPTPDAESTADPDAGDEPVADDEPVPDVESDTATDTDASAPTETAAAESDDVSLDDAVVDAMKELDDGDGADHDAVVEAVVERTGVSAEAVEEAIEDALMGGRCYEPADGKLKPI